MLSLKNVSKTYRHGNRDLPVLRDVSLEIPAGSSCALVGPSGSGKSTLLGLCAGLDRPTSGTLRICDRELTSLDEDALADFRGEAIGFVFQSFHLISSLTALENVMVPAELRGRRDSLDSAKELLSRVGLADRFDHYPTQLSGGEQQRVAIARAYVNRPKVLLGDEPTGNLDAENAKRIEDLLFDLNREHGTTLVLATHNPELAARAQRTIALRAGSVVP